ncbi:hypothetical protein COS55_01870 [Candidatus Shapirobacteria bacterium CG03_land_8_20_14_0_80_40_19]|uniref:Transglycosylase SLT domain-containing protein n=4 Tax=Candidatus Shapironibacteriota TaxID=1752721 RepID=A0A2M7BE93_9BACT|nr:MAG: hypothetical protein COV89_03500 [Candidatus Shapirobacteria bacterium CG11_big_fil_rev_8_21_14_0_20_40_12]PIV01417.1 MAG: hypothetical protein COS55_01870 [Candidatus Shapirobacteria bacterium CG03_land_8_20_14_0_80_40_19]PJC29006.1 MAG: hypothetical protein CO053_01565 [Candidatus Shapirobacteria bacterium CG_4_9_14_0_2_um_filter_40_11]PJC77341.1 MAG: hypothetical protein CO010_00690 [Candidatus Shapirobacteria bacterium CG_4_8_14_3_um_filter_39_11]
MTKKLILCLVFFIFAPVTLFSVFFLTDTFKTGLVLGDFVSRPSPEGRLYAESENPNPKVILPNIKGENSISIVIEKYLRRYNSPLLPYAGIIVSSAEKSGIDPKLIVAIAQQESNLGKSSPENCFNAWGWGIHSEGTKCYTGWAEAIESVTAGISLSYCSKGYCEDPCLMMKKYTPNSNGSWCAGVNQFLTDMELGNF